MELEMPAIDTSGLDSDTAAYARQAYETVRKSDPVGIMNEPQDGVVPVEKDSIRAPYAGVTEFEKYRGRPRWKRTGINSRIKGPYTRRVLEHEFDHGRSGEALLPYMDVGEHQTRLIMESYAEFAGIRRGAKKQILQTTPYHGEIKFAYAVDSFYKSDFDGVRGYGAFIKDIQRYGSARRALVQLGRSIKESGASMREVLQTAERKMAA